MLRAEKDFEDFIELLNKYKVEYLIVGAYAVAVHARPRNTGDIDIFINATPSNAALMFKVLDEFGFDGLNISENDFLTEGRIIQLGVSPVRIDILNSIDGVVFKDCYSRRESLPFGKTSAAFISKTDLIINKKSSNRVKDRADLDELQNF